ncbi:MAG: glycosyltransferase family 8 protein [Lachnospiraceae bacterium]|nr:glycosyltransferase family 8 protein [Lachnospiraceae bacterium]
MDILYQFNEKYAPYAGVSMTSLFENSKASDGIRIWILGEGLSEDSINRFEELGNRNEAVIRYINAESIIEKIRNAGMPSYRGAYSANIRLFVSEIFPEDVNRVVYLDSDTIVQSDISALFNEDLEGCTIGMVYDSLGEEHKADIGLSGDEGYYNSGVILFDMQAWRERGYTERIIEHVTKIRAQYPSPDQDLLNVVCRGDIHTLPVKYNLQPVHSAYSMKAYFRNYANTVYYTAEQLEAAVAAPAVVHFFRFIGEFPWNRDNVHPFNDLFNKYMEESLWNDYVKKPADNGTVLKCEKILFKLLPRDMFLGLFRLCHRMFYAKSDNMSRNNQINKDM